jgi:hypothetical protein
MRRCRRADPLGPVAAAAQPARPGGARARTDRARIRNGDDQPAQGARPAARRLALLGEPRSAHAAHHDPRHARRAVGPIPTPEPGTSLTDRAPKPSGSTASSPICSTWSASRPARCSQSIEPVDLTDAVASRGPRYCAACSAGMPITLDVSPELPLVSVDPQLFHHCLINLLENAGKYGDPGTPITVAARRTARRHDAGVVMDEGPACRRARKRGSSRPSPGSKARTARAAPASASPSSRALPRRWGSPSTHPTAPIASGACFTIRFPKAG